MTAHLLARRGLRPPVAAGAAEHVFFGAAPSPGALFPATSAASSAWTQFQVQSTATLVGARLFASRADFIGRTVTLGVVASPTGYPTGELVPAFTQSVTFTAAAGANVARFTTPVSLLAGQRFAVVGWRYTGYGWPVDTAAYGSPSAIQASDGSPLWLVANAPGGAAPWRSLESHYDFDTDELLYDVLDSLTSFGMDPIVTFP